MKNSTLKAALLVAAATLLPGLSYAQGAAADIHSMQGVLNNLYDQMIPLCSQLIDVGRGIAGFAAMFYIAFRVWRHISAAEPIDFYPLLRPFAIGFCITIFPSVLAMINGVLSPTVSATAAMVGNANAVVLQLTDPNQQNPQQGASSLQSDPDKWYQYSHPDNNSGSSATNSSPIADQFSGWSMTSMIKRWMFEVLNLCFEAAALCIDTIRTFKLIVLAILGPLVFGLSIFDGFQHTLKQWLARYINVYMWLPVANIFGAIIAKIQGNMIQLQQSGAVTGNEFANSNTVYLIFLLIGIVGYFTVPSIAGYIVNAGGHALLGKTTSVMSNAISFTGGAFWQNLTNNRSQQNNRSDNFLVADKGSSPSSHLKDKLSGNS